MEERDGTSPRAAPSAAAVALLLAAGAAFGLAPSLARTAVTGGIAPMGYVFWMGAGAAAFSILIARARAGPHPDSDPRTCSTMSVPARPESFSAAS